MRKVDLNMNELMKYTTIKRLVDTNGNKKRAAIKLDCSIRHINRMIVGYNEQGKAYFLHGNRGRIPKHALSFEEKANIVNLYVSKYWDCSYTLFSELLASREDIYISTDEARVILSKEYILSPKAHKATRKRIKYELLALKKATKNKSEIAEIQSNIVAIQDAHPRQPRCQYFGEEVQMDASIHKWFGNFTSALHIAIDDSTGSIIGAYFDKEETLNGYYNITKQIIMMHGIPYLLKTDKRTVFEYKKKSTTSLEDDTFTQFAYACNQLGIQISSSSVPEFKPRVERVFNTLQSRLIVELRLANIFTLEQANLFLQNYIAKYNDQFALCINHSKSVFEKQPDEQKINLILAVLSERTIDRGHSIKYEKKYYKLVNRVGTPIYFCHGTKCMVIKSFDNKLFATVGESIFALEEIPEIQAMSENFDEVKEVAIKNVYIPRITHPMKKESFDKFILKQKHRIDKEIA